MVERVSEPLTKFLFDSLKNKRAIDESFISEVIELVVNALGLNEYVRDYKINNKPWGGSSGVSLARYTSDGLITLELKSALEFFQHDSKKIRLEKNEVASIIYDRIISLLLHELEHAHQSKKRNSQEDNIENKVIKLSSMEYFLARNYYELVKKFSEELIYLYAEAKRARYHKYYKYDPSERLAEYYSHKTMAIILKELGTLPNISYFECLNICHNYIRGYIEGIVPTKFYLEQVCSPDFWPKILLQSQNLDFETRVSLGLPISEEEYKYLEKTTATLERIVIK